MIEFKLKYFIIVKIKSYNYEFRSKIISHNFCGKYSTKDNAKLSFHIAFPKQKHTKHRLQINTKCAIICHLDSNFHVFKFNIGIFN